MRRNLGNIKFVLLGMLLGVMLLGQLQDGWSFNPYRTVCASLVFVQLVILLGLEKYR